MAKGKKKVLTSQEKKKKYASIAISIVLAFCLWIYASNTDNRNSTRTFNVPVEFLNISVLESNGLVLADQEETYVKVEIEGRRSVISSVKEKDIVATVDVSSFEEGEKYADIVVHAPSSVSVVRVNPSQLRLTVETKVTEDKEVVVDFNGSTSDDVEAVCTDISTEIVAISGAKSAVSRVSYLSAPVDISKLSNDEKTFVASLIPMDSNGNEVKNVSIAISEVSVKACLYNVKTVDLNVVTVGSLPDSLELASIDAPDQVTLAGPASELKNISEISTNAVDLSQISSSTEVELKADVPGNVRLASSQSALKAVITVRKMSVRSFTLKTEDIKMTGVPDGMDAVCDDQSVTIEVRGTDSSIEALSSEDFTLSADCSSLTAGTSTVKLAVELSNRAKQAEITVSDVSVNITVTEEDTQ